MIKCCISILIILSWGIVNQSIKLFVLCYYTEENNLYIIAVKNTRIVIDSKITANAKNATNQYIKNQQYKNESFTQWFQLFCFA